MKPRKFWPLDFDSELEIYESPAWDLPGLRKKSTGRSHRTARDPLVARCRTRGSGAGEGARPT